MAKLLILAALLFFSSETGVCSVGPTTSPQQQNPQAGADKDPCEILLSMLYPQLFTPKSLYFMTRSFVIPQFITHVCQAKHKKIPHQS